MQQPVIPVEILGYTTRMTDDHTLEVDVDKGQGLNDVFDQLSTSKNVVLSMRNKANRLEELFVTILEKGRE